MYIRVRITPDSKKEIILKKKSDHFEIAVKEPAQNNLANKRVLELIAHEFKVPLNFVRIISGHHSPGKILDVKI